jgi:hypothetical protein
MPGDYKTEVRPKRDQNFYNQYGGGGFSPPGG